jgi:hypothetical protein
VLAGTAQTAAGNAQSTANGAYTTASGAQVIGANAQSTADVANSTANIAYGTAVNATGIGNNAQATANIANGTANTALTNANNALNGLTSADVSIAQAQGLLDLWKIIGSGSTYINGGKIWTGTVTADSIVADTAILDKIWAGTITGKIFQTDTAGSRIVINSTAMSVYGDIIDFYNSSSIIKGYMYGTSNAFMIFGADQLALRSAGRITIRDVYSDVISLGKTYFTEAYNGYADTANSEIANDVTAFQTLMILGNSSGGGGVRRVGIWDYLQVVGDCNITGTHRAGQYQSSDGTNGWTTDFEVYDPNYGVKHLYFKNGLLVEQY